MDVLGDGHQPETALLKPSFATWMGDQLKERHLSQEATARMLDVSLKTVNRWVNGRTEPRMRELRRIQENFGAAPPL